MHSHLLNKVRDSIRTNALLEPNEPVWVAVSGGVDSMVLLHALHTLGHPCSVAHVDHGLRGAESDADRDFVHTFCETRRIPFLGHRVDVSARRGSTGESIQMAARELRSNWFEGIATKGPHKVATAHHADDALETFFMGLIQGMGLRGWSGIPIRNGPIIRPLLGVGRNVILAYAQQNELAWREDKSNADTKYLRNRVRHEWLPMLEEWRPGTRRNLIRDTNLFAEMQSLAKDSIHRSVGEFEPDASGTLRIPFDRILGVAPTLTLYHLLRDKGVHPDLFDRIIRAMEEHRTGSVFHGSGHRVLVDRTELVIELITGSLPTWEITDMQHVPKDAPFQIRRVVGDPTELDRTSVLVAVDALRFPLELRPWKAGDRMRPLGLGGSKLVSDILIDAKVPRDRKSRTYVLVQEQQVIWLCGHRLSEGFQVGSQNTDAVCLEWFGA